MDEDRYKQFIPMTETAFYILLSFVQARHGYDVIQHVASLSNGRVKLGAGTLYGTITKLEASGLIRFLHEEHKRKYYQITELGQTILQHEAARIKELYHNVEGLSWEKS